ncbi:MAG: Flp pilus assembly complex ATPase component TadA [Verrucomicrobia bacterium]|nr:Flp pilus assembly complex ATPase component TadA [Verrucomicrobiota bacterium]
MSADHTITFSVRTPDGRSRTFHVEPGVYSMGSDPDNRIVLPGDAMSWRHAVLSLLEDGCSVEDLMSEGGTFVDGDRVSGRVPVVEGQVIKLGEYQLIIGEPSEQNAGRPEKEEDIPRADVPAPIPESAGDSQDEAKRREIKRQIHQALLDRLDIKRLTASHINESDLRAKAQSTIKHIIKDVRGKLPADMDPDSLAKEVFDEAMGLGPLEDLLEDPTVTEIMVNGADQVYVEREGKLHLTRKTFLNNDSVLAVIERIVSPIGRRIDESQPYVDARLQDGSRVNAIIHPLSLSGPCVTIRKFSREPFTVADLVGFGTLPQPVAEFLRACVLLRKNIVVSGGTGSGKTTLLNVISSYLPHDERIVTIEDAAELRLGQKHVIRLESRPPNIEGRGAITIRDLVRNALRMRPDRIIVGECRGGEALDMLQAMNTGHEGSLTTVHANSPRDVISRLETMVLMAGMDLPVKAIREQISSAIHLIVHIARFSDGSRKISRVTEVVGLQGEQIGMQDLFVFKQTGLSAEGGLEGAFAATGSVPTFSEEWKTRGVKVEQKIFDPETWTS